MATEVKVPDIGDFDEVPVIEIHVAVGDTVSPEDPLITLESDKAAMDVPSPIAGTVKELKVAVDDKVKEGSVILIVDAEGGAAAPADEKPAPQAEEKPAAKAPKASASAPACTGDGGAQPQPGGPGVDIPDRVYPLAGKADFSDFSNAHASPSVRRAARELDVDLNGIEGTGEKGRITKDDLKRHLSGGAGAAAAAPVTGGSGIPPIPAVDFSKFGQVEDVEMSRITKISGPALHRSWLNIPHVTHNEEADITETDKFRKEMDTKAKTQGYRVTLLSFLIKASVKALREHWQVNSSIHPDGDKLIRKHYCNIGFAADTPNGLMVPVIKDADRKGIVEISKELGELSAAARDGKLKGGDMQGASFTISSLGGIGGTQFTPIVNPPEVGILGITRATMQPVWNGSEFIPRLMCPLDLTYDHRVIDGADAARFMAFYVKQISDIRRLTL